jgi:hypothetical protein
MSRVATAILSIAIGALLALGLIWSWARIAASNPLPMLFAHGGLRGVGFQAAVAITDLLINMVLCLPAALGLWLLGPRHILVNTLLAVAACMVCGAIAVGFPVFSYGPIIWITYLLLVASLPIDVWLLSRLGRNAPNNSFKPTPLRGAA